MGSSHLTIIMSPVILLTVLLSVLGHSLGRAPFYPMDELQNIEQVVSSVGGIAQASASQSLPRVARQAQPLMPYRYGYAVQDDIGNDFNQQEQSDGAQVTGQYSVLLPDGRIQTSTYSVAPDTGFVVEVAYSGGNGGVLLEGQVGK